jgi:FkbM family methyltransferase
MDRKPLLLNSNPLRQASWRLKKPIRTLQSYFPFLKETKDRFYLSYRRLLRVPSEPFFAAIPLFRDKLAGCYVDVGGNIGQSIESMRLYAPNAKIISFEPNPILAGKLVRRYRCDARIQIRDVGLSDRETSLTLYVPSYRGFVYDGLGSLDLDTASSWIGKDTVYFFDPRRLVINSYQCAVETLDSQKLQDPIFIKIDVEGTEYQVVKGGVETIRKFEPIILVEGFHEKPELGRLVSSLGYEPYTFTGKSFIPGPCDTNTFLITRSRSNIIES